MTAADVLDLLKRLEWCVWDYDRHGEGQAHCPACRRQRENGHDEGCELAFTIDKLAQEA